MEGTLAKVVFQLLGTIILVVVIMKFTYKNILIALDKRANYINNSIKAAKDNKELSAEELSKIQDERKEFNLLKNETLDRIKSDGLKEKEEILLHAKKQAQDIVEKGHQQNLLDKKEIEVALASDLVDYVSLISKKYISDNIDPNKEKELIGAAIKEFKVIDER